ncbi:MAG: hypothetical protein CMJ58_14230 [Planctomycetaceae bacterium]|nr:hypothetical protein [Planctomycetaceae bacterium]
MDSDTYPAVAAARASGFKFVTFRQMVFRGLIEPDTKGRYSRQQAFGLRVMHLARINGATTTAALAAYDYARTSSDDDLLAEFAQERRFLVMFGDKMIMKLQSFDDILQKKLYRQAAAEGQRLVVIDLEAALQTAIRILKSRGKVAENIVRA